MTIPSIKRITLSLQSRLSACLTLVIGVCKVFPDQKSSVPNRKMRNQELTQEEKGYNQNHSRKMIVIEHAICRMKKYRPMGDIFRNSLKKHDKL